MAAPATGDLDSLVRAELTREASAAATRIAEAIVSRHGDSVAVVLFYGSCLRSGTSEGVLDFYVLVDSYAAAYGPGAHGSRVLAWVNALLPPNVFYLEVEAPEGTLRSKYAVVSGEDFTRGARPGGVRSSIWARFCQPTQAVWIRDEAALATATETVGQSIRTAIETGLALLPSVDGLRSFTPEELWQRILRETYASEMRTEAPESIQGLYEADPARYERVTRAVLDQLTGFELRPGDGVIELAETGPWTPPRRLTGSRRLAAKAVYLVGLLKSTFTFGDWLPYVLWKLERHTGTRIVPTERQRRHPLIWGWPLLFRVLWQRDLR